MGLGFVSLVSQCMAEGGHKKLICTILWHKAAAYPLAHALKGRDEPAFFITGKPVGGATCRLTVTQLQWFWAHVIRDCTTQICSGGRMLKALEGQERPRVRVQLAVGLQPRLQAAEISMP